MLTSSDRFNAVVKYLIDQRKVYNMSDLSKILEFDRSYFTNIKTGKKPVTENIANKISSAFPELSMEWILTGEGRMLKAEEGAPEMSDEFMPGTISATARLVPLLPTYAQGGSLDDYVVSLKESECEKIISPVKADLAIPVTGDSMAPEYPSGSQVLVKKVNEKAFLEWGKVYVIDTCNGAVIKELRKGKTPEEVECVSLNPDPKYQPFSVRFEDTYGFYRVVMCMALK